MPIRRTEDRREEIGDWDSWVEKELANARERGEFDNIPSGQPLGQLLDVHTTSVNPERDLGFSRLKNAGVMPVWMELDGDCHRMRADLDAFLERSGRYLEDRIDILDAEDLVTAPEPAPRHRQLRSRFLRWWRLAEGPGQLNAGPLDRLDLLQMRSTMKAQYLERAIALDKRIVEFNNSLERALFHLERMRMLPDRASKLFEVGCPQIPESSPPSEERT